MDNPGDLEVLTKSWSRKLRSWLRHW